MQTTEVLPSACMPSQLMWWIHLNSQSDETAPEPSGCDEPIGHIALDWVDYAGDTSLANKQQGIMCVNCVLSAETIAGDADEESRTPQLRYRSMLLNQYNRDVLHPRAAPWYWLGP